MVVVPETTAGFIVERLDLGQRVGVLVPDRAAARPAHQAVVAQLGPARMEAARVRVSRGAELVQLGQGVVTFHPLTSTATLRGLTLDALYYPQGLADQIPWDEVSPALAVSGGISLGYWA